MSFRLTKYRITCSKIGCRFDKVLPLLGSNDKYLLSDNTTINAYEVRVDGWCNTCNDFCKIFAPKSLDQIKSEMFDIEDRYNNSGFLGFNKKRSIEDVELFELNKKILDLLRKRKSTFHKCVVCNGEDIKIFNIQTLLNHKILHPNCTGYFIIEKGTLVIGSNLGYGRTSFTHFDESAYGQAYTNSVQNKGQLLDVDDNVLSNS